ncbi:peptidase M1 [Tenacibaculum finnmarkense]|uniref:Aminopeptidase N n=1 Tax=Tenacibaculum finnmarkense genomovar finnmarkense TaxID=1458503 RepID=A0AAP1WFH8_9FLAO|nr:M1 family aminopeptidase [Tenacibaculum finnmarkense]MBE7651956.1 peptidase M1 [Tenacibaculum finnmarkense genomovar finnmarkense]MBE7694329.1 peptidase M1 [Tenacibaculum finnmarkense genomovar finnmarkense]MCD8426173.1 M1 family aminopeptidase [Tenacibaculum finnmarkense genomovar finnmarkense]MCG8729965.1 peptidase M1 [Tenacibaculum finnmarkense]MCG8751562.1 peptidase M1 [Tenacibaculum finnmarkense]
MKHLFILFASLLICGCNQTKSTPILIEKGISKQLATYRKQQVDAVKYALTFNIPEAKSDVIPSTLKVSATIKDLSNDLILDFNEKKSNIKSIIVNNKKIEIIHQKEHLIIAKKLLIKGKNSIDINFDAGEMSLNRSDDFLYTLLVPDRASTLFPCFDQPDIKANYTLTISAPKKWKVLCAAFEASQTAKGNFIEHKFKESDTMSTYLFSFVAGIFNQVGKNPGAFDMQLLYRENNEEKITESIDEIFNIHQKSIDFLEKYTAYKFPFQKMDFAAIPPFQYGGMEHVGAIQYKESSLFLDKNATQNSKLSRAKLIAHETAHMWFGNLVTMKWFNDVWIKEVFANFIADKIMNPVFPDINHQLQFIMAHYPSAYSEDRTQGTNEIRQNLDNLKNAGSLYGRIIYNKAPIMMRQLEQILGEQAFKEGIQEYIKTYANKNADWNELVGIFNKKSAKDIVKWSNVWVHKSGRPIISDSITYKNGKISSFKIYQKAEDKTANLWTQSFSIALVYPKEIKTFNISLSDKKFDFNQVIGLKKPTYIVYNYNGLGYGVFPIDSNTAPFYNQLKEQVARGYAYINLYENLLNNNITAQKAFDIFLHGMLVEKNELIASYISGKINTIYWSFFTKKQRTTTQQELESKLLNLLNSTISKNLKRTAFGLYKSIAISDQGKEFLYQLWAKKKSIPNLYISSATFTDLATKLAVYKHPKASEILTTQLTRISNPDKLKRFKWLLPSLSEKEQERDDFMRQLFKKENREKEAWVQAALYNIHHPLRQKSSIKHFKTCLTILEEIQLTGDIFFPKRWLSSSVGEYSSKEAFNILQNFLKENPNYNPILKMKLLQTTDNLIRVQNK